MGAFLTISAGSPCCTEDFHVNDAKKNARLHNNGRGKNHCSGAAKLRASSSFPKKKLIRTEIHASGSLPQKSFSIFSVFTWSLHGSLGET